MKPAVSTVVFILSLLALLHALRIVFQVPVLIGNTEIPMWISVLGIIAPAVLAIWIWRDQKG